MHLPLGTGTVDAAYYVRALQLSGYNGTITLEVFTPDPQHLAYSRSVLRQLWDKEAAKLASTGKPDNQAVSHPSTA